MKVRLLAATSVFFLLASSAAAQIAPPPPDPLARIRANAVQNAQACTVEATSPCAEANPKIIAAAQQSPTLEPNLKRLLNGTGAVNGSPDPSPAVQWALEAFKAAGVEAHTETFSVSAAGAKERQPGTLKPSAQAGAMRGENVVAEIRGREKPQEYVVLSSHLDASDTGPGALNAACNAAMVIEAARAIHLTGLRPRRSMRFVLFSGQVAGDLDSWGYVQQHGAELDHTVSAISFAAGAGRVTGFSNGGRPELNAGVREVLAAAFDPAWGVNQFTNDATLDSDNLDFLLQGVPTLLAIRNRLNAPDSYDEIDMATLKLNAAVTGVLVFGLAEREMPLGSRLSRAQIEASLEKTGLADQMRKSQLWDLWQSGGRGRKR